MKDRESTKHDLMAAAVDWLDAYRSGNVAEILELFAQDASINCGCSGIDCISGREALHAYWMQRVRHFPATELKDLQHGREGVIVAYVSRDGIVRANITFNADGKISSLQCGPSTMRSFHRD